jgi:hypothetical protein
MSEPSSRLAKETSAVKRGALTGWGRLCDDKAFMLKRPAIWLGSCQWMPSDRSSVLLCRFLL